MIYRAGALAVGVVAATAASAYAYAFADAGNGFLRPFLGIQHVLAMLAVGLWAGLARGQAVVLAPAMFVVAMVAGTLLAIGGIELPGAGTAVAVSVIVFGLFHGAAHGPAPQVSPTPGFVVGFAAAAALIQLSGIGLSGLSRRLDTEFLARGLGAATAATGIVLVFGPV